MKREPTVLQVEISNLRAELKAKDTRIAELEAKLKPKTCDGCEYEDDKREGHCYAFHAHCSREPASDHFTPRKEEWDPEKYIEPHLKNYIELQKST